MLRVVRFGCKLATPDETESAFDVKKYKNSRYAPIMALKKSGVPNPPLVICAYGKVCKSEQVTLARVYGNDRCNEQSPTASIHAASDNDRHALLHVRLRTYCQLPPRLLAVAGTSVLIANSDDKAQTHRWTPFIILKGRAICFIRLLDGITKHGRKPEGIGPEVPKGGGNTKPSAQFNTFQFSIHSELPFCSLVSNIANCRCSSISQIVGCVVLALGILPFASVGND